MTLDRPEPDPPPDRALTLVEAARRFNVPFTTDAAPADRFVDANGLRFHYLEWGRRDRPTILMLHGVCQQAHSWDFIALALQDRYRVIALDARGHGDTEWPSRADYSLQAHQRDLDAVAAALKLRGVILIGHSMGGRNGYVFASRHIQKGTGVVKALVIVDTGPGQVAAGSRRIRNFITLPDELDSFEEFVHRVMEYTGRPRWLVLGSLRHTVKQAANGKWTWKYDRALRDPDFRPETVSPEALWACIDAVTCPAMVVRGAESDVLSPEVYRRMLERLPCGRGAVVPNAGHLVPGDNPRGFLAAVEPFLAENTLLEARGV